MRQSNFIICSLFIITLLFFLSCSKQEENKPLKETQVYGSENHLPTRNLLSFLPQPDALALVSPSIENITNSFFKIDNFRNNEISNSLKKDPTLGFIIKENKEKTLENLKSLGIDISQPCAFFYTLANEWEVVIKGDNIGAFTKLFPSARKTTLKTSWTWFISGKLSAYWDSKSNIAFTLHNGHIFLSNNIGLLTKSIAGNTPPPSFHYGLDGKPIISSDETVILLSISDELKTIINNPKKTFEPEWLKALILALDTDYDEVCVVINPEENLHEIACAIHSKQQITNNNNNDSPRLRLSQFLPDNCLIKFNLALTNGLKNFMLQFARYNSSEEFKKNLGRIVSFINSPLFQDEISLGTTSHQGSNIPTVVFITMCKQIETLKNLLSITAKPDEPISDFDILRADLEKLVKVPISLYIGLKDPHVIITDDKEQLVEVTKKITESYQQENTQYIQSACPYGFFVNDTDAINTFFSNNQDILNIEAVETLSKILPIIPEMCMYNNESWYLLKVKVTI